MPINTMGGKYFYNGRAFNTLQEAKIAEMEDQRMRIGTQQPASPGMPADPSVPDFDNLVPTRYTDDILPQIKMPNQPYDVMPPMAPPAPAGPQGLKINSGIKPQGKPQPNPGMPGFYGSSMGQQPAGGNTQQKPQGLMAGLLDKFGGGAGLANRLGSAYLAMSQDPQLQQFGMQQIGQIQQRGAEQRQANKTLEFLRARGVDEGTLKALADNPQMIGAYAASLLKPTKPGTLEQGYEYAKSQGYKGTIEDYIDAKKTGTTIYTGDRMGGLNEDYLKEGNKLLAKRHQQMVEVGDNARRNAQQLQQITDLNYDTPDGFAAGVKELAGRFGIELGEGVDNVQAVQAVINRLVPAQRPPGSGPMSDADLALFKRSLPQLMQQASGRQLVIDLIQEINQYDIARADIAEQMLYGDLSQKEGRRMLKELDDNTTSLRERIKAGNTVKGDF